MREKTKRSVRGKILRAVLTRKRVTGAALGLAKKTVCRYLPLLLSLLLPAFPSQAAETVEYDNLRQLLIDGNLELQDATDTYYTNLEDYEKLIQELSDEQDYMKLMKEKYEDSDPETAAQYQQSASALASAVSRLNRQLTKATGTSGFLSTDKTIDSYTMTAQTLMNTYCQARRNLEAKEKSVEAAQAEYETTELKAAAGAATAAELESAGNTLLLQQNLLESYRQQADDARFALLSMLGIADSEDVTIGTVPEADVSAVDAIDFETDLQKAIGNSSSVKNVRHQTAQTATEIASKSSQETAAVGAVTADLTDSYQQILAKRSTYTAACEAFAAAEKNYASLQRKQQAGMLTRADYLSGEAEYLEALAEKETASMNLRQAIDEYYWQVKGVG